MKKQAVLTGWPLFFRQSQTSQLNKGHNEQLYNGNADLRTVTVKTALPETSIRTKDTFGYLTVGNTGSA